ncbi:helix-turn-helix domain-containing protein [Listeria kieliensis]|nr:helix-turn-helix domain-containing protein [Listeria kieliensis]
MTIEISKKEQLEFLDAYFLSTAEAIEMLQISKQNFYSLVNRNKIQRIKKNGVVLYFRDEILERLDNQNVLRRKYRPFEYQD